MTDSVAIKPGEFIFQGQERVLFGQPCEQALLSEMGRYGSRRVFVVSTRSLNGKSGPLQRIETALGERHVGTFAAVRAHSPREDVIAAANAARDGSADLLVAVGGGSVIDATKAAQLCLWLGLTSPASMEPYRSGAPKDSARKIEAPPDGIRMIAISTTLSASEFTASAGVTDSATHSKQSFMHRLLVPRSVVLDPTATEQTPEWLLHCTGMRAIDHAVESYCSPLANPATEAGSLQGLRLLVPALSAIKQNPGDLAARMQAQFGMWQSIMASAAGVPMGASHGIGYALGATYDVPHGHTSCVMLPAVLQWNRSVNGDRQRELSKAMGDESRPASDLIAELVRKLEQPQTLRAVGIQRDDLDAIAHKALGYGPVRANPRPIRTAADVREILELAW